MRAGELITAEEAVRRVLILENPALRGQSAITQSLYAGLQLILPGEVAPSHRHTQIGAALHRRGQGRLHRGRRRAHHHAPGDFIITPSWTWHDHGHDGRRARWSGSTAWTSRCVRFFDAGFAENDTRKSQPVTRAEGTSLARYGHNMAAGAHDAPFGATSPIFSYPYARSREALAQLERRRRADAWDGVKLRYVTR